MKIEKKGSDRLRVQDRPEYCPHCHNLSVSAEGVCDSCGAKKGEEPVKSGGAVTTENTSKYADGIKHIRAAIESLGGIAHEDPIARESIANLSVVLLDLNG